MSIFAPPAGGPAVVGHRGAPREAAENTPASFAAAAASGATWIELDARRSADDEVVVVHDARTPDGVPVVARDAAALGALGVFRLADVLDGLPPGLGVDVEVKNLPGDPDHDEAHRVADLVAALLAPRRGERPLVATSFNPGTAVALAAGLPDVPVGLVTAAGTSVTTGADVATELGLPVLCPHAGARGLDAPTVAAARARGLALLVWTVDDVDRARELAASGVDAICTDDPRAVVAALAATTGRR